MIWGSRRRRDTSWVCKTKRRLEEKTKSADSRGKCTIKEERADQSVDAGSVANWDHAEKFYGLETERQEWKQTMSDLIFSEEKEPIIKCLGKVRERTLSFWGNPQEIP